MQNVERLIGEKFFLTSTTTCGTMNVSIGKRLCGAWLTPSPDEKFFLTSTTTCGTIQSVKEQCLGVYLENLTPFQVVSTEKYA